MLPLAGPNVWVYKGLTSEYTLKILKTIKLVMRAFMVKDIARLASVTTRSQLAFKISPVEALYQNAPDVATQ